MIARFKKPNCIARSNTQGNGTRSYAIAAAPTLTQIKKTRISRPDGAVAWHAHEFLFGYIGAVMTGFLLTVVPNWTGRLPVRGRPLLALFLLWLAGRAALLFSDTIGVIPAWWWTVSSCSPLAAVALREVLAARRIIRSSAKRR